MSDAAVLFEVRDGAGWITLNRPATGNALDAGLVASLLAAMDEAEAADVGVLVLQSTGRFFCVGGDLAAFADDPAPGRYVADLAANLHRVVSRLTRMDAVVVAAVAGPAAGAGFSLAAAADLILAARSVSFTLAYTRVGLSPDGGSTAVLPHSLGLHRSLRLALLNPALGAEEAHRLGLVAAVHDDADLPAALQELVSRLVAGSRPAQVAAKRLLRDGHAQAPETQMELEGRAISRLVVTPDGREGVAAFVAKRPPRFAGRPGSV